MPTHPHVLGFAHRGARAHARENTIEAFLLACRMGATALETDVWLSRDGIAIVDHDGRVGLRGLSRPLADFDRSDLPTHMPTLEELGSATGPTVDLSIDVKDPDAIHAIISARRLLGVDALRHTWLCDDDIGRLQAWRALDADIRLVASLRRRHLRRVSLLHLHDVGIQVLNLPHRSWTPALVERCHDAELRAFAWGVQRPARMRRHIAWGIDAIYSDHTDRMVRVIDRFDVKTEQDAKPIRANRSDSAAR